MTTENSTLCVFCHNNTVLLGNPCFPCNAAQLDEFRTEIQRRDQEILAMSAKMKTLEEQHQDYQRHIAVLKESLCAKEEHYNMLQADVSTEWCLIVREKVSGVYVERVIVREQKGCCVYCMNCITVTDP